MDVEFETKEIVTFNGTRIGEFVPISGGEYGFVALIYMQLSAAMVSRVLEKLRELNSK